MWFIKNTDTEIDWVFNNKIFFFISFLIGYKKENLNVSYTKVTLFDKIFYLLACNY